MEIAEIASAGGAPLQACSVGIMTHNEAANVATTIRSLLDQRLQIGAIVELIVVASGCTDETVPIVEAIARADARVRLLVQERREGKASAINFFLRAARAPIVVLASADVIPKEGALDALLAHFRDPAVGMVGAHPVPVNRRAEFLGHAVHLLWRLHDRIAQSAPKLGEVVAFRNVLPGIPGDTPVDEVSIQALIEQLDYRLVYEPRAIVYNCGPTTIGEFLRQRRRIAAGHLQIRRQQRYSASTMSPWRIAQALLATPDAYLTPKAAAWTVGAAGLELWARALGWSDHLRRRPHQIWQIAQTTKSGIADGVAAPAPQSIVVFRIRDFHRHELEHGARGGQALHRGVVQQLRKGLEQNGTIIAERAGTAVVALAKDRADAGTAAERLIAAIEAAPIPINGGRHGVRVELACGIIAFHPAGDALAVTLEPRSQLASLA